MTPAPRQPPGRTDSSPALLGLDAETACCGRIRSQLERLGTPIGANDLWIAAQRHGTTVVTDNLREFERVPGLGVEDWLLG